MPAIKRPFFNKRAQTQLKHLNNLNKRYTSVQKRWANFFNSAKIRISMLKVQETQLKHKPVSLKLVQKELRELEGILDTARTAYQKKQKLV